LVEIRRRYPDAEIRVRIDAAGQYARNLETFLRNEPLGLVVSVGEPQRNRNYRMAHSPSKKSDKAEAEAMARYAVVERPAASIAMPPQFALMQQLASRLQGLSKDLTRVINRFHGVMANVFPELAIVQANLSVAWVLELLSKWPTPERLAKAKLDTVKAIHHLSEEKAEELVRQARESVGTLRGPGAEELVRVMVQEVRHAQSTKDSLEKMLVQAYQDLPAGNYHQLVTIPRDRRSDGRGLDQQDHRYRALRQPREAGGVLRRLSRGMQFGSGTRRANSRGTSRAHVPTRVTILREPICGTPHSRVSPTIRH
jgi:hypothetical protein